jgi:hypothetical protein
LQEKFLKKYAHTHIVPLAPPSAPRLVAYRPRCCLRARLPLGPHLCAWPAPALHYPWHPRAHRTTSAAAAVLGRNWREGCVTIPSFCMKKIKKITPTHLPCCFLHLRATAATLGHRPAPMLPLYTSTAGPHLYARSAAALHYP